MRYLNGTLMEPWAAEIAIGHWRAMERGERPFFLAGDYASMHRWATFNGLGLRVAA